MSLLNVINTHYNMQVTVFKSYFSHGNSKNIINILKMFFINLFETYLVSIYFVELTMPGSGYVMARKHSRQGAVLWGGQMLLFFKISIS